MLYFFPITIHFRWFNVFCIFVARHFSALTKKNLFVAFKVKKLLIFVELKLFDGWPFANYVLCTLDKSQRKRKEKMSSRKIESPLERIRQRRRPTQENAYQSTKWQVKYHTKHNAIIKEKRDGKHTRGICERTTTTQQKKNPNNKKITLRQVYDILKLMLLFKCDFSTIFFFFSPFSFSFIFGQLARSVALNGMYGL